jgi:hypothetical protein
MIYLIGNYRDICMMLAYLLSFIIKWIVKGRTEGGRERIRKVGIFFVSVARAIFPMLLHIHMLKINIIWKGTSWTT